MKTLSIVLLSLSVAACGRGGSRVDYHPNGGQTITIVDPKNGKIQGELGASAKMPTDLPSWAPAYPGSTVLISQTHDQNGVVGAYENVMLQTPDDLAKVSAFYDQQFAKAGVKPMHAVGDDKTSIRLIEVGNNMISVNVTKDEDKGSDISISRLPK